MPDTSRRSYAALDIARFVMALFVVAIHTQPQVRATSTLVINGFEFLVRLAVPFFFLCAGFFLFRKVDAASTQAERLLCIRRYTHKMGRSYLLWTAAYLPISLYGMVRAGGSPLGAAAKYGFQFLFVGEQFYSWPLWYLLACVYAGVFLWVLFRLGLRRRTVLALSLTVYVLSYAATYAALWLMGALGTPDIALTPVQQFFWQLEHASFEAGRVLSGVGFLPLGMLFARGKRLLPRWADLTILAVSALIGCCWRPFTDTPLLLFPAAALFDLLVSCDLPARPIHLHLRKLSSFIYYIHMMVLFLYNLTLGSLEGDAQYGVLPLLVTAGGCLLLYGAMLLIQRAHKAA